MLDALKRVPGVGEAQVFGGKDYSMRVWLNPHRLAAKGLTISDVAGASRGQSALFAAGRIGGTLTSLDAPVHDLPRPRAAGTGRAAHGQHAPLIGAALRCRSQDHHIHHPHIDAGPHGLGILECIPRRCVLCHARMLGDRLPHGERRGELCGDDRL